MADRYGFTGVVLALAMIATGAAAQQAPAWFRLEVSFDWGAATHPFEFPADAHFSGLAGVTHDDRYVLFADGLTASGGLELVAENGRDTILQAEWAEAARKDRVGAPILAEGVGSPGVLAVEFEARPGLPFLSFVTMLAPSPDWFTGVSALPLTQGPEWIAAAEVTLWAWDAGTDGGTTYAAGNLDTQPRSVVRLLATPHVLDNAGLRPVGHARLRRIGP